MDKSLLKDSQFEDIFLPKTHQEDKMRFLALNNLPGKEILQRYAILENIVDSDVWSYLSRNYDYFKDTIYSEVIKRDYPDFEILKKEF